MAIAIICDKAKLEHCPVRPEGEEWGALHSERREAIQDMWEDDVTAAIGWYSQVSMEVMDGGYDALFEPRHTAILSTKEGGKPQVKPISGFKRTS
jgi:hypothetical protein